MAKLQSDAKRKACDGWLAYRVGPWVGACWRPYLLQRKFATASYVYSYREWAIPKRLLQGFAFLTDLPLAVTESERPVAACRLTALP